jgi:hypothetical protein
LYRLLAPFLGLDKGDEEEISEEGSLGEQRIKMMQVWLSRYGKDATYLNFVRGCEQAGRRDLVDTVYSLVQHSSTPLTVSLDCGSLARLGRAPTLPELYLFTGRTGTRYRVLERLAPFWEQLALALHFEPYVTETVKKSAMFQINDCCRTIMQKWLQGYQSAVGPVTWETLLSAMAEVEDLAVLTAEIRGEM